MSSNGKFAAAGDKRRMSILRQGARAVRYRLAAIVRYHLARHGLLLLNTRSRLGLDYIRDIEWLAQSRGYAVETFFDVGANVAETALAASPTCMSTVSNRTLPPFPTFGNESGPVLSSPARMLYLVSRSGTSTCSSTTSRYPTVLPRTRHLR